MFTGEMVLAILEGRKTQTRRVVNPQPFLERDLLEPFNPKAFLFAIKQDVGTTRMLGRQNYVREISPYQPKMKLWVREKFKLWDYDFETVNVQYDAGDDDERDKYVNGFTTATKPKSLFKKKLDGNKAWHPSIFMPRWASRITLEITEVRAERLNNISPFDALAEGINPKDHGMHSSKCNGLMPEVCCFRNLWDSINSKKHPWSSNPWVWVISFKRL